MRTTETEKRQVLDHGYIQLIETMGSDERIIEAARMSTGGGFKGWGPICRDCGEQYGAYPTDCPATQEHGHRWGHGDERLLRYLWTNRHTSPFEMCEAVFEIKAPIFVARQWMRHRTQSYNEASARYAPLATEDYVPSVERLLNVDTANKQAQGTGAALDETEAMHCSDDIDRAFEYAADVYRGLLKSGVPKELARCVLPVSRYTVFRAKANLLNWLKFVGLRSDSHAQWEIRQYSDQVAALLETSFPRTLALFNEGRAP